MARPLSPAKEFLRMLSAVREPLAVLNSERRVVYCNEACAAWLGVSAEELVGNECHYHAGDPGQAIDVALSCLCPPPEVFEGRRVTARVPCPREDESEPRRAEFTPLWDDTRNIGALVWLREPDGTTADQVWDEAESRELHEQLQQLRQQMSGTYRLAHIIGNSPAMRRVREQVRLAIQATTRVVVVGDNGSGREHVARTIHYGNDSAAAGPLVPLSCSLLDPELLRATVTAFARRCAETNPRRPGALLLLDVDALPPETQSELAGFLTLPTFRLHTIATARASLTQLADAGSFDPQLAMLLSVLEIALPPLDQRRDDVPLLAQHFLEELNAESPRQLSGFTSEALDALFEYPWPGNLDELRSFVRESAERCSGTRIGLADLPKRIHLAMSAANRPPRPEQPIKLDEVLAEVEAELIRRALRRTSNNKAKAARLLGISRPRLLRRIEQLGIT
ncbi:MAG: sigma 54-interacting transcriptional regulator [Planctomycetales bacterium]|nr:sigma 54-interacting transcriptional regulator [Planctomycetales bacterium]